MNLKGKLFKSRWNILFYYYIKLRFIWFFIKKFFLFVLYGVKELSKYMTGAFEKFSINSPCGNWRRVSKNIENYNALCRRGYDNDNGKFHIPINSNYEIQKFSSPRYREALRTLARQIWWERRKSKMYIEKFWNCKGVPGWKLFNSTTYICNLYTQFFHLNTITHIDNPPSIWFPNSCCSHKNAFP